ncbi:hypothetical protein COU20_03425 [Candidatus Kaiserbacteria bacterium CG10_big_fil_rev_8_21_14_0_10_59_10]|uniref:Gram-positive cocci surface proteins LPxTG domain-containing protein n=1 Tax=Candidatus Kaiserbacteria bacterium CG10_big_fil_rev_8_21_14_0_10_59_10 TaxID=1974612 RepID=A0A2H0U6Y0_9BACT|nr:MAG: hypothetical protein COU20_03425 [Candidatus Kaiserbacteria bacterium CG10_big_fil_rev_8_21_14_0_10_59_10]
MIRMTMLKRIISVSAPLAALAAAGIANAQTATQTATTATPTPGIPETGVGGDMVMNLVLLGAAALIAGAGAMYLYVTRSRGADRV